MQPVLKEKKMSSFQTSLNEVLEPNHSHHGIGIVKFFQKKNYLITGATGFLAKVFIEKMLRTVPDVGMVFLLIKARNKEEAMHRLKSEIIDSELFKCLAKIHGKSYKAFMMSKLVPVVGNVCESNLGMDNDVETEIFKQVDVIVNIAANTTWDERYDISLNTNTRGPYRLLSFAKKCKKLNLFLHVSTAYVNGEREGIVLEKPFCMGESVAREKAISESQLLSLPVLDVSSEMKAVSDLMESGSENEMTQKMKELGQKRAKMHGWQNTYIFTKAMGEMVINSMRGDIPVVIIRPSLIESTFAEPFPGWIQGYRTLDPLILSYAKGQLPGFLADPNKAADVIPADMVVNATMAAMAKHGKVGKPGLNIYHVASSVANPILFGDVMELAREYFTASPLTDSQGKRINLTRMKFFNSIDSFTSYIQNDGLQNASISTYSQKVVKFAINLAKIYEPCMFFPGRFDSGNTQKLMEDMSTEELKKFGVDVGSIDWKHYFLNIHIPGMRRHVVKEKIMSAI